MAKFPYSAADDKALEKGEQVARARYWTDLRTRADEIIEEHKEYGTDVSDLIHQAADNAVIYTKTALDILTESENYTAIDDVGEIPQEAGQAITAMAYWAFHQDLSEVVYKKAEDMDIELNPSKRRPKKNAKKRGKKNAKKRGKKKTKKNTRRRN